MASLPTAANILSSLGIKGSTVSEAKPGFVPVLDANGKLSASLIPSTSIDFNIPPISSVAFVDPGTEVAASSRDGSVAAPFGSISEAAANFSYGASRIALVLAPGSYSDSAIAFSAFTDSVYLIGLGKCDLTALKVEVEGPTELCLQDITATTVEVAATTNKVVCLGSAYIEELLFDLQGSTNLLLASSARVSSVAATTTVQYLSEASRVGYTARGSQDDEFPPGTVGRELDRLRRSKVRVMNISEGSTGILVDSDSSYVDLSTGASGDDYVLDLRSRDRIFIDAINKVSGKELSLDAVSANTIEADTVKAAELDVDALAIGGYSLTVDMYGYLVVADSLNPPQYPLDTMVLVRDPVTSFVYILGVSDGRMYVARADEEDPQQEVLPALTVWDDESGIEYNLGISNGRLVITRQGGDEP